MRVSATTAAVWRQDAWQAAGKGLIGVVRATRHPAAVLPGRDGARYVCYRGLLVAAFAATPPEPAGQPARRSRQRRPLPVAALKHAARAVPTIEHQRAGQPPDGGPGRAGSTSNYPTATGHSRCYASSLPQPRRQRVLAPDTVPKHPVPRPARQASTPLSWRPSSTANACITSRRRPRGRRPLKHVATTTPPRRHGAVTA